MSTTKKSFVCDASTSVARMQQEHAKGSLTVDTILEHLGVGKDGVLIESGHIVPHEEQFDLLQLVGAMGLDATVGKQLFANQGKLADAAHAKELAKASASKGAPNNDARNVKIGKAGGLVISGGRFGFSPQRPLNVTVEQLASVVVDIVSAPDTPILPLILEGIGDGTAHAKIWRQECPLVDGKPSKKWVRCEEPLTAHCEAGQDANIAWKKSFEQDYVGDLKIASADKLRERLDSLQGLREIVSQALGKTE